MILVFVKDYVDYTRFLKENFPYFPSGPDNKDFAYVFEGDENKTYSIERGIPYFLVNGKPSEWFKNRFTQIQFAEKSFKEALEERK